MRVNVTVVFPPKWVPTTMNVEFTFSRVFIAARVTRRVTDFRSG
jgi:hypothetical protein